MHVLITVFDPVICKTPDAPLHCFARSSGNILKVCGKYLHLSFVPHKEHERVSETGVFPSPDRVSGTLGLSHYVTEISHLYSLRDLKTLWSV